MGLSTVSAHVSSNPTSEGARRVTVHPECEAVVHFDPSLTFECVDDCSWCCHHGVLLYGEDVHELASLADLHAATVSVRGEDFVKRRPHDRSTHVADDGHACFFLDGNGRCAVQLEADWKPTRCSVFPLRVERRGGDIHVDVRDDAWEHCEGLEVSERRVIDHLDAFLPPVLWTLENPDTKRVL